MLENIIGECVRGRQCSDVTYTALCANAENRLPPLPRPGLVTISTNRGASSGRCLARQPTWQLSVPVNTVQEKKRFLRLSSILPFSLLLLTLSLLLSDFCPFLVTPRAGKRIEWNVLGRFHSGTMIVKVTNELLNREFYLLILRRSFGSVFVRLYCKIVTFLSF